jgi:hypothetical protein
MVWSCQMMHVVVDVKVVTSFYCIREKWNKKTKTKTIP